MDSNDMNQINQHLNNIANQISGLTSTVSVTNRESENNSDVGNALETTNLLLGILIVVILLNTFVKWRSSSKRNRE